MHPRDMPLVRVQSTWRITTLGGASEKCPYSRNVLIPEVSFYVLQLDGTLIWAWRFCRYSRIVVISAVVISEVDCMCLHVVLTLVVENLKSNFLTVLFLLSQRVLSIRKRIFAWINPNDLRYVHNATKCVNYLKIVLVAV